MMAIIADVFCIVAIFFVCFQVKKPCYITEDGISLTLNEEKAIGIRENFSISSLWILHSKKNSLFMLKSRKTIVLLFLILCGDIESCPGPTTHNIPEINTITSTRGMHFFHQNVRGLLGNIDYIRDLLETYKNIDIFSLSETHITTEPNALFDIPGYSFINKNRTTGKGGGVAFYISDSLVWKRRRDLENEKLEILWLEIFPKKAKSFIIGVIYRPPDTSKYLAKNFTMLLNEMLTKVNDESKEMIITGDVNVNYLDNKCNKEFKNTLHLFGFKQLISKPTRITQTTSTLIDIIATNKPNLISNTEVIPTSIGDHEMIACTRKINNTKYEPKTITCRDYKNYDANALRNELNSVDWSAVCKISNVNLAWQRMKEILTTIFDKHAPRVEKKVKGKPSPWLTDEIKSTMNERNKLLRRYRKYKKEIDFTEYKVKRNQVNILIRKEKSSYHKNLLHDNHHTPNKFWSTIKKIYPSKSTVTSCKKSADVTSNGFRDYFINAPQKIKEQTIKLCNLIWRKPLCIDEKCKVQFKFEHVSKVETESLLKKLKTKKSSGIDDLPARLLKDAASIISAPLSSIINSSLKTGVFPSEWKHAKVVPSFQIREHH